jgi:hypothetical protein
VTEWHCRPLAVEMGMEMGMGMGMALLEKPLVHWHSGRQARPPLRLLGSLLVDRGSRLGAPAGMAI